MNSHCGIGKLFDRLIALIESTIERIGDPDRERCWKQRLDSIDMEASHRNNPQRHSND